MASKDPKALAKDAATRARSVRGQIARISKTANPAKHDAVELAKAIESLAQAVEELADRTG